MPEAVGAGGADGGVEHGGQLGPERILDVEEEAEGEEDGAQLEIEPVQHHAGGVGGQHGGGAAQRESPLEAVWKIEFL